MVSTVLVYLCDVMHLLSTTFLVSMFIGPYYTTHICLMWLILSCVIMEMMNTRLKKCAHIITYL